MSLLDWLQNVSLAWLKSPSVTIDVRFEETGYKKEKSMPPEWKYFKPEEVEGLNEEYVAKLDMARAKTIDLDPEKRGVPFIIASGFRSPEKNQSIIGAVSDSAHLKGLATDLVVSNDHEAFLILAALISVGINRIGIYINSYGAITHVHNDIDNEGNHVPGVIWIKGEGKPNSAPATV